MDFEEVSNFFGGTIFPEEYRTDFQRVDKQLQTLKSSINESSSVDERAAILLLQSIDGAMRGEFAFARRCLDDLQILTEQLPDQSWRRRCVNYRFHLVLLKRSSPFLRFGSNFNSDSGVRREQQVDIFGKRKQLNSERAVSVSQGWSALEKLESDVILNNSQFIDDLWQYAYPAHPNHPHPFTSPELRDRRAAQFNSNEPYLTQEIEAAQNLSLDETAGYLRRLTVEYWLGGNSETSAPILSDLCAAHLESNDIIGAANCKLIQGDRVLSLPFTSPLTLNLFPFDKEMGLDNDFWDATETRFPLRKREDADTHYQIAYDLFTRGNSRRGGAAVHLRRGCVEHMEALAVGLAGKTTESALLYRSAGEHFKEASQLFQLDSTNSYLVRTHQLLLDISVGDSVDALNEASQIGAWGKTAENSAVSQFLGLLILRFGRKLFLAAGDNAVDHSRAVQCCACARTCFKNLGDPLLELQAVIAHAMLHQRLGNSRLASALLAEGQIVLPRALECLDQLIQLMPNGIARENLKMMRNSRLQEFEQASRAILGPGASASSTLATPMQFGFAELLRLMTQPLEAVNTDYHQTMKNRRGALVKEADVDTSENYLRGFLARWGGAAAASIPGAVLASMKVAVFHYLGEFDNAGQVLRRAIPVIYGGENNDGQLILQMQSMISGDQTEGQRMLAEQTLGQCFLAKDWQMGQIALEHITRIFPAYPSGIPLHDDIWQLFVWVGCIDEHNGRLGIAFEWYLQALRLLETHRHKVSDPDARRDLLATIHSGELYSGLARISWQFSRDEHLRRDRTPQARTWKDEVLLYLEQGRSRTVVDLLMAEKSMDEAELDKLQEWNTHRYHLRQLDEVSRLPHEQGAKIIEELVADLRIENAEVSVRREELISTVRQELERRSLGLTSVLAGANANTSTDTLYDCIPADAACVQINLSRDGLLLLCITSKGIQLVSPAEITDIEIERTVLRFLQPFRQNSPLDAATCMSSLKTISAWIIDPVANFLRDVKHVIFVPSRSFHKFPFSALLLDDKPLFLQKQVSQVPSLTTLSYLAQKTRSHSKPEAAVVVKADKHDEYDTDNPLPWAGMEAANIARIHGCTAKNAGSLSDTDFCSLYESSRIVHIATHGFQGGDSAWDASISLRKNFRVHDLAKLRSKAAMVVFSSCVSGLGEDTIGNDMLGFSHAVIASGALAFLGGLWNVDDLASMLLMVFFHRGIAERKPGVTLAGYWAQAQRDLYELDKDKAKGVLEQLRDGWDQAEKNGKLPAGISEEPRVIIQRLIDDLDVEEIDFTHPHYWASFVLVGHGGLVLHTEAGEESALPSGKGDDNKE